MPDINGTPLKDIVTVKFGETYHGQEGDDEITILKGGTGQGMQGNDLLIVAPGVGNNEATVWYWYSPNSIYVDMQAGYALDGYGTRDTLVNVHQVHGFQRDGDKGFGTSVDDYFYLSSNSWSLKGTVYIDGRGGYDRVSMGINSNSKLGPLVFEVSADSRVVKIHHQNSPNFFYELHNVEYFNIWDRDLLKNTEYDLLSMADLSKAGESILLRGYKGWQTQTAGAPVNITYSFMLQAPASGAEGGTGFVPFSAQQQQVVRNLLNQLQLQTGMNFTEVAGDTGQIRFGVNQQTNTRGYSFIPDEFKTNAKGGDVWLDVETMQLLSPGQEGYYVLLHELAHALGLQHPLPPTDTSGATVLLNAYAKPSNTLMLELTAADVGGSWPAWFGSFDLQALRSLYGTRAYATSNDIYKVTDASTPLTLIDDGGLDTLDASTVSTSATIDLHGGKSSSIGVNVDGIAKFSNVTITATSVIENVIGSPYDDVIIGNAANNTVTFTGGNDIVDGDAGLDAMRFTSAASTFRIFKDTATGYWNVEALNNEGGSLELNSIERLLFTDTSWAFDVGATENAGITAKILGAVFSKSSLANKAYVGIGISFLDSGWTYDNLAGLALDAAGAKTHDQIVSLLWKNIIGSTPSEVDKAPYIALLKNGMTPGALVHLAADSSYNTTNINLVGLVNTGIEYTPFSI